MSLNTVEFLLSQAYSAIKRNGLMTLASITNVTVSLGILGVFLLAAVNLDHMASLQTSRAVVKVFLHDSADEGTIMSVALGLKDAEGRFCVSQEGIKLVGKEEAQKEAAAKLHVTPEFLQIMASNPFPRSLRITPARPELIEQIAAAVENLDGVLDVSYRQEVTRKLLVVARAIKIAGLALFVLLILAMVLIVSTTIRLTIHARRREIRIMQLVGATNWFIRVPFILEGLLQGIAGGVLAAALTLLLYLHVVQYVDAHLEFLHLLYGTALCARFCAGTVLLAALVGGTGSLVGLRNYLAAA